MIATLFVITMIATVMWHPLAMAEEWDSTVNLNPRFEFIDSVRGEQARRTFLKAQSFVKKGDFGLSAEAFFERDWAADTSPDAPDLRRSRESAVLQEAYVDYRIGGVFLRAGRQPVRWSQSWALPSLDIFTGRRWNRLFLDPVPEQLIHPDGLLVSFANAAIEAELFQVIQPANNIFPKPLPFEEREPESQTGVRVKTRLAGFDLALIGHVNHAEPGTEPLVGASLSYALEHGVLKAEAGRRGGRSGFVITGVDFFFGDFTFGPQLTWFTDPDFTGGATETVAYAPLRYAWGRNAIELQYYRNIEKGDEFASALYSRDLVPELVRITAYAQSYEGAAGRLFGIFKDITGGGVFGLRLDFDVSI